MQKRSADERLITTIKTEDEIELEDQFEVIIEIKSQYASSMSSKGIKENDFDYFIGQNLPKFLDEDQSKGLEGEITNEDVKAAVKSVLKGKTQGLKEFRLNSMLRSKECCLPFWPSYTTKFLCLAKCLIPCTVVSFRRRIKEKATEPFEPTGGL